MAGKPQKPEAVLDGQAGAMELIESLREKHGISRAVFVGACAANGWKAGKALTPKQFLDGIAIFTGRPMNGCPGKGKEKTDA